MDAQQHAAGQSRRGRLGPDLAGKQARRHPRGRGPAGNLQRRRRPRAPRLTILQNIAGDEFTKSLLGGSLHILDALPYIDPPEHTQVKGIAFDWFKPNQLKKWEDQVRDLARESIEHLKRLSEAGEIDLLDDWALGFPLHV